MRCPLCGTPSRVIETRTVKAKSEEGGIRRRRECAAGHRFSTEEKFIGEVAQEIAANRLAKVWR